MQTIYLDIYNRGVVPTIYSKQGDVGRKFEVIFTDSGVKYNIPNGSAFSVWYSGESGEGNYTDIGSHSAFSVNENKVVVEMISQMLTNDGTGILCLVLNESNGNQIGSWNIPYLCEKVPGSKSEVAKEYYTAFSESVEKLKQVTDNLTPEAIGAAPAVESADYPGCYYRTANGAVEWINPPMVPDEEYRTTERYNGKPVYTQLIDCGSLPSQTKKLVDIGHVEATGIIHVISCQVMAEIPGFERIDLVTLPAYDDGSTFVANGSFAARTLDDGQRHHVILLNAAYDWSVYKGYALIRYLKDYY